MIKRVEMMIIPKNVVLDKDEESKGNDTDIDSDDDFSDNESSDDDDDEEDDEEDDGWQQQYDAFTAMPDIGERLNKCEIPFVTRTITSSQHCIKRTFYKMLNEDFKSVKGKGITPSTKQQSTAEKIIFNQKFNAMHKQRFCFVVYKRKDDTEVFMYQPNICKEIPSNHVNEWFFESSIQCLIPGKSQSDLITCKTSQNGYMFNLSFHVEERDVIKCYLYTRSSVMRFFREDIYKLLPEFFVESEENQRFKRREDEDKQNGMCKNILLKDIVFKSFREQTSGNFRRKLK